MFAASLVKAALSATALGVLLSLLRHAGPRAGGLAAAVPINSMPALFWLSLEHGDAFVTAAALGALWGTGLTVLLAVTFGRLNRACPVGLAAVLAWLATGTVAALTWNLPAAAVAATALCLLASLVGQPAPARPPNGPRLRTASRSAAWWSMAVAGAMSLLVAELSRHVGPQYCGLVAAIPVVGMCALFAGYRQGGAPGMFGVLSGYLDGMAAKAAFLGALASAWAAGAGAWAWPTALAVAGFTLLARRSLQHGWQPRPGAIAPGPLPMSVTEQPRALRTAWRFFSTMEK